MGRLVGLLVIALGVGWMLNNFGVLPEFSVGELIAVYWPLILIYFGVIGLFSNRKYGRGSVIGSFGLLAVGVGLQLDRLGIVDFFSFVLPLILILGGLVLLFGKRRDRYGVSEIAFETEKSIREAVEGSFQGKSNKSPIGSLKLGGANWKLETASYRHKIGDVKVDLRETEIPLGETVLEISCNVGDVDVRLPEDAEVWIQTHVKMGDVKVFDQRNNGAKVSLTYKSEGYEEAERKLKLLIWVKMGDIDVKRFE